MNAIPINIAEMDKDALFAHALGVYAVELDKRKKLDDLRKDVAFLAENGALPEPSAKKSKPDVKSPSFLRHPVSGIVFDTTPHLQARGDMIPCDAEGVTVQPH